VNIRIAKSGEDPMKDRTKNVWLPGMVSRFEASLLLLAMQRVGLKPSLVWMENMAMLFYWPWLAGLPVFGAVGAYPSLRA
jgi:hypothetical protein